MTPQRSRRATLLPAGEKQARGETREAETIFKGKNASFGTVQKPAAAQRPGRDPPDHAAFQAAPNPRTLEDKKDLRAWSF